jgi:hypothetical protein
MGQGPLNMPPSRPEYTLPRPNYGPTGGSVGGSANWPTPTHVTPAKVAPTKRRRIRLKTLVDKKQ